MLLWRHLQKLTCLLASLLALQVAHAAEITYNAEMRPVRFTNLDIGGTLYHVIIEWNTSFVNAYKGRTPLLWGSDEAWTAAGAMRQALLDDGYTAIQPTSYLWVPNASSSNYVSGPAVFLHLAELPVNNASYFTTYVTDTIGFARFALFYDSFE